MILYALCFFELNNENIKFSLVFTFFPSHLVVIPLMHIQMSLCIVWLFTEKFHIQYPVEKILPSTLTINCRLNQVPRKITIKRYLSSFKPLPYQHLFKFNWQTTEENFTKHANYGIYSCIPVLCKKQSQLQKWTRSAAAGTFDYCARNPSCFMTQLMQSSSFAIYRKGRDSVHFTLDSQSKQAVATFYLFRCIFIVTISELTLKVLRYN